MGGNETIFCLDKTYLDIFVIFIIYQNYVFIVLASKKNKEAAIKRKEWTSTETNKKKEI